MRRVSFRYTLLFLAISILMFQGIPAQEAIETPELENLKIEEAWRIIHEKGLSVTVTPEANTRYQPGTVFEQDPPAGSKLPPGASVKLKVATGLGEVVVPGVLNQSREQAQATLQNSRLSVLAIVKITTAHENGTVFEQEPSAGRRVAVGTPVRLSIASVPRMVEVPDLLGRPLGEARALLYQLDLSMGASPELVEDHPPGAVFDQNPPPGTSVPITTPVYLKVAIAADLVEVPDLSGRSFEEAWKIFQDARLAMAAAPEIAAQHSPGSIIGQSVTPGDKVPAGTPVTVKIATASQTATVSHFAGQSFEEAQAALQAAGLPAAVTTEITGEHEPGAILEQSLPAGSAAAIGTPVYIKVAVSPEKVKTPSLTGKPLEECQAILQESGLPVVVSPIETAASAPGTVVEQSIVAGKEASIGTPIYLGVAVSAEMVAVPRLSGQQLEEARKRLRESGLSLAAKPEVNHEYSPGIVFQQNPSPGTRLRRGSPVHLKVATDSAMVEIPRLQGRSLTEAQAILQYYRLPMMATPQPAPASPPGMVFEQIPPAGKPVSIGTPVYFKTALDAGAVEVPSFVSLTIGETWEKLRPLRLSMIAKPEINSDVEPGTILEQEPPAGSRIRQGSPLYFTVALGNDSVAVPDLAGRRFEDAWAALRDSRLSPVILPETTGDYEPGIIFRQITPSAKPLPAGSPLYLKLTLGEEEIEFPDLAGRPLEEARRILNDLQIPMVVTPDTNAEFPSGTIIRQSLAAGTRVLPGTPVFLASAAGTGKIVLPDFIGKTVAEVRTALEEAGLQLLLKDSVVTGESPGVVVGQNPPPGTEVEAGAPVTITVAVSPPIVQPSEVEGRVAEKTTEIPQYLIILAGAALVLGIGVISFRVMKRRRLAAQKPAGEAGERGKEGEEKEVDLKSEVRFELYPDLGRQTIEAEGALIMEEMGDWVSEDGWPAPAGESGSPDSAELKSAREIASEISDLMQKSVFLSFAQLAAALRFKAGLKALPDPGNQAIQCEGFLILPEIGGWPAESGADASGISLQTSGSLEERDIREAAAEITEVLNSAAITTFAQLAAALKFKMGLKAVPDAGKQSLQVGGPLIEKNDLAGAEEISPRISKKKKSKRKKQK